MNQGGRSDPPLGGCRRKTVFSSSSVSLSREHYSLKPINMVLLASLEAAFKAAPSWLPSG